MSQEHLNLIMTAVVIPILTILATYVVNYIKLKSSQLQDKYESELVDKYIREGEKVVSEVVTVVSQTFVDTLKKNNEWNSEKAKEAFELASAKAVQLLAKDSVSAVEMVYGDLHEWLKNRIEYSIKVNK